MGLIYFEGGPLNGTAYDTKSLLGTQSLQLPVNQYVWTSETKTSELTNETAQIWRHESMVPGVTSVAENGHAAVAPPGSPVQQLQQPVIDGAAAMSTQVADEPQAFNSVADAYDAVQAAAGTTPSASAVQAPDGAQTASVNGLPTGDSLFERRKAMKLSVGAVVERCSLAHSKIGAIEKGVGKRVKDSEILEYATTLAQLEAERGGAGAHA